MRRFAMTVSAAVALTTASVASAQESPADLNARADALYLSKEGRSRLAEIARLYVAACEGGDGQGCINAGYVTRRGEGVERDEGSAAGYFRRACDLGMPWGCQYLRETCTDAAGAQACQGIDKPPYAAPQRPEFTGSSSLTASQVKQVLAPIQAKARSSCGQNGGVIVRIRMTIAPNGRVVATTPTGDADPATVKCVVNLLRSARFPASTGPLTVAFPFRL